MRYVEQTLEPGERVIYVAKYHWLYTCISYLELFSLFWLAGLGILLFFLRMERKWTTHIAVTNKRFIYDRGWLSRRTIEVGRERIAGCKVSQSALARGLGFGTVTIAVLAIGEIRLPRLLEDPIGFRNVLTGKVAPQASDVMDPHADTALAT